MNKNPLKVLITTLFALMAFAGNSVLCRLALGEKLIDPASFTTIRLFSGVTLLIILTSITKKKETSKSNGSWLAASMLFIYAVTFSFGYVSLDTGTGALILFGAVQITMIICSVVSGNKLHISEWLGLLVAFSGFAYLVIPNLSSPSLVGFILMTISGIAWGFYTLAGRGSKNPLGDTAFNFLRTLPFILALIIFSLKDFYLSPEGVLLAVLSGAIASGVGYFVWYIALGGLSVTQAAVVQLFVPIIAALGGILFTNEQITQRLIESSILVLGGILAVIKGKKHFTSKKSENPIN